MFENEAQPQHRIVSKTEPIASLSLQMFLELDKQYLSWAMFISTLLLGFYKVNQFGLPHFTLEFELVSLIILHFLNQVRLYIAIKSNKTEKSNGLSVVAFLVTSLATLFGLFFFLLL